MGPVRRTDWQDRLTTYLAACAARPFAPGRFDCALFVAGGIAAMTGTDPAAGFRGRYSTLRGGQRVLRRGGFADHVAFARAHLEEVPVAHALPGDVAALRGDADVALGIVQGERIYVATPAGLASVPLLEALAAFVVAR